MTQLMSIALFKLSPELCSDHNICIADDLPFNIIKIV